MYEWMYLDDVLATFEYDRVSNHFSCTLTKKGIEYFYLVPFRLCNTYNGFAETILDRSFPEHRRPSPEWSDVEWLVNTDRSQNLRDQLWVRKEGEGITWKDIENERDY